MGVYVRNTITAGPFRFTMSRSGLNVSAGIPGLRVGTNPRGNYIRVGGSGVHYRTSARRSTPVTTVPTRVSAYATTTPAEVRMDDVTGAPPMHLLPTGSGDVVEQLNAAVRRRGLGWPATVVAVVLGLATLPYGIAVWALAIPLCTWVFMRDAARRRVVLFYEVDGSPAAWFEALNSAWVSLSSCHNLWRVVQSGDVRTTHQHKTNAGASSLVSRVPTKAHVSGPRCLSTNVSIPSLTAGTVSLYFLPDRVLFLADRHFTDVSYQYLQVRGSQTRFIERGGSIPRDAHQVDQTWQYVNVKGGPDRRFANNPIRPIMLYGCLDLYTTMGFDWRLQSSSSTAAPHTATILSSMPPMIRGY